MSVIQQYHSTYLAWCEKIFQICCLSINKSSVVYKDFHYHQNTLQGPLNISQQVAQASTHRNIYEKLGTLCTLFGYISGFKRGYIPFYSDSIKSY